MISAVMIVKDGDAFLEACLTSLAEFDEVILMDTGSTDGSLERASKFGNVRIFERPFEGFGPSKNQAAALARHDWIFSVDCDEVVSPELSWDIRNRDLDSNRVYRTERQSYYNHKLIRGCGWSPDWVLRLYDRRRTSFNSNRVHESVQVLEGMEISDLEGVLRHYPYDSVDSLVRKAQFYSSLYAEQNAGKRASSPLKAGLHGFAAFFKGYIIRKGLLDGYEGFAISVTQGLAAYLKYIKLYELNRKQDWD